MSDIYYDEDADPDIIRSRRVAVIGYGNQGRAHAQNLRDSGCDISVGLYDGSKSWTRAEEDGFSVGTVADVCRWANVISILLADQHHREVFQDSIAEQLETSDLLLMAHGFSIQFGLVDPPRDVDVALVAPVSPGATMRSLFTQGVGVPAVMAVHRDVSGEAQRVTLSYARGLGCTRAGVIRTTFREETETDLFGEQAVLCGGLTELIRGGFDTLVEAGYQPELAYFECLHQVKLIVDLIYQGGLASMFRAISDTAEFGAYLTGPRIIDQSVRGVMREALSDIQNGTFARRWMAEYEAGLPTLEETRERYEHHLSEDVGAQLRAMMGWLQRADQTAG